jgi:hypothetical protein
MSVAEMKLEVIKQITKLEDETLLQEVMTILEKSAAGEDYTGNLSSKYDVVKDQYDEVLRKLAQ